jgi:hypothetical protein
MVKMKIALCIAGQPRGFKTAHEFVKRNLLDQYDVDVFIHTWESEHLEEIAKLYNPVAMMVEKPLTEDFDSKYTNTPNAKKWPPRFTVSSYYSIYRSCELKTIEELNSKVKYDWVIRTRFDYALNTVIPFAKLDNTKLYIPNCRMVPTRDFGNDQFAFGSSDTMNGYMSTYLYLNHYYDQNVTMIGEDMCSANLKQHNLIGDKLVYVDMNNPFPPGPHNGTWHSLVREDYEQWAKS